MGTVNPQEVHVFFYGSFINLEVLKQADYEPRDVRVARLAGFELYVGPLATLRRSDQHCAYGILCRGTHAELDRLYALGWIGTYRPEAVIVERDDGVFVPALCYIAPADNEADIPENYVSLISEPARRLGFPSWYVKHIEQYAKS